MRKIFISVVIIILVMASCSHAAFRVSVPDGWTRKDSGNTVVISSLSSAASVAVAFNHMGGADLTDIVERLYIQMGGTDLAQDEDGDYSFTFTNNSGASSVALITGGDGYYLVISLSGFENDESAQNDIERILDSLDWVDD